MEGFPGAILQSVCCVTTHVQYKGRGAAAAPPLPVGSSGEILFYGFSGERSQALMCVCQGMRNTLTDREPQGKEERRGPALCKGSVRHPDPASAQPKATSPCPSDTVGCQSRAPHRGHWSQDSHTGWCPVPSSPVPGLPHSLAGVTQPLSPALMSKPDPIPLPSRGMQLPPCWNPKHPMGAELR